MSLLLYGTLFLSLFLLVGCVFLLSKVNRLTESSQQLLELQNQTQAQCIELQEQLHELRTGSLGIGHKVRELMTELEETQAKQEQLQELDPESRLYTRAAKMAQQGASAEEIALQCEIPPAEAELLVSLNQTN